MRESVSILVSLLVLSVQGTLPPPPAVGDIRLLNYTKEPGLTDFYEVLIYYSDGKSKADYGGVCADDEAYADEAKVICRQLGYHFKKYQTGSSSSPVWFKNIECKDGNTPHILQCQTQVASNEERNNPNICGQDKRLLINCNFNKPLDPYDGQVTLCPTNNTSWNGTIKSSTSFGLVGIYYTRNNDGDWKGINQKDERRLTAITSDTICRQMGFTGAYPGTAVTQNAEQYNFSSCYSNTALWPPFTFTHGAWVTTRNITCQEPQNCLGCCLPNNLGRGLCTKDCHEQNNIVIRCAFDPTNNNRMSGSESSCTLNNNKEVAQCKSDNKEIQNYQEQINKLKKTRKGLIAGIAVVLAVALGCCVYLICKKLLHDRCQRNFNGACQPMQCCGEYVEIDNNQENAQINDPNQNQPA